MVVVTPVVLDDDTSFGQRPELFPIEAFIAEETMGVLNEAVLPRARRLDIDVMIWFWASQHWTSRAMNSKPLSLRRYSGAHAPRWPCLSIQAHQRSSMRAVGPQHVHSRGIFIQDGQYPQGSALHRRIRDEVLGPDMAAMIRLGRQPRQVASAHDLAFGWRHSQPLHLPLAHPLRLLHPLGFVHLHLPEPPFPSVEGRLRDVRFPDHFFDAPTAVGFPQDEDFIFCAVSSVFHSSGSFRSQTNSSPGAKSRAKLADISTRNLSKSKLVCFREFVMRISCFWNTVGMRT
jgi:hypothetical protein